MNNILRNFELSYSKDIRGKYPDFKAGDTIDVTLNVNDGNKVRKQSFSGIVMQRRHPNTNGETFTVRKVIDGIFVERIFPILLPDIDNIEIIQYGNVRRARLYYLRGLTGKAAKVKNKITKKNLQSKNNAHTCVNDESCKQGINNGTNHVQNYDNTSASNKHNDDSNVNNSSQMTDSISIECKPCKKHVLDNSTCDENVSCGGKTSDVQDK